MSDGDKVCCLVFDEMSIRENLHFNQKFGCVDESEDLGRRPDKHNCKSCPGVHALWSTQEVEATSSLPFDYGSTMGERLVNFLMDVLDACISAGLEVVATVCDMGANSIKALKLWVFLKRHLSLAFVIKKLQLYKV